jgi:UDP-glucose:(heptosyl)LPS alpha-1,3-glucosyltransferase
VHVFANRWETLPGNVQVHKVWAAPGPYFLRLLTFAINATRKLRRYSLDLVNVQGCCALAADVVTAHSCHRAYWQRAMELPGPARLREFLNPFHYVALYLSNRLLAERGTRWIVAVSEGVRNEIHDFHGFPVERIMVRPPGVDLEKFHPANRAKYRAGIRSAFSLQRDDFVLLFVGNEFDRKGLDLVLQAMARINEPGLKLLVAGGTSRTIRRRYERLARELAVEACFAGRQPDMDRIYAAADVFVLPSLYEAFPMVVLEAAASGLPILGSRTNGISDVLVDGHNGFYVQRDAEDIAARISVLMQDRPLLDRMGAAARASVQLFDCQTVERTLLLTYSRMSRDASASFAAEYYLDDSSQALSGHPEHAAPPR